MTTRHACIASLVAVVWLGLLGGCSGYVLSGKVVQGRASDVTVVRQADPRLAGDPVAGAMVRCVLDPNSGGREVVGQTTTDELGRFEMPIDALGAGTLEYELLVIARAPKKSPAETIIDLPSGSKRLLVTLAPGRDRPINTYDDPLDDIKRHMPR